MSNVPLDGEQDFDSPSHKKGMQQGALPKNLEEDLTSSSRLASDDNMVKLPTKHPHTSKSPNPSKSKEKTKGKKKVYKHA